MHLAREKDHAWLNELEKNQTMIKEKLDVLDFIINTLREHERTLDTLIGRLEILSQERERKLMVEKI